MFLTDDVPVMSRSVMCDVGDVGPHSPNDNEQHRPRNNINMCWTEPELRSPSATGVALSGIMTS